MYFLKDPDVTLDYQVDWAEALGTDTIATSQWVVPTGLTLGDNSFTSQAAIGWLSGGTAGTRYRVVNRITTAGGRTDDRELLIEIPDYSTVYAELPDLRQYLNIQSTSDDWLLYQFAREAKTRIDTYCRRTFLPYTATRQYLDNYEGIRGSQRVLLDEDLLELTAIANANGTTIPVSGVFLEPLNRSPKSSIRLKVSHVIVFNVDGVLELTGRWGFSETVPADILHVTKRLVGYWYRQRDAQVFDVTVTPDTGQLIIPKGLPPDIVQDLAAYVRTGQLA